LQNRAYEQFGNLVFGKKETRITNNLAVVYFAILFISTVFPAQVEIKRIAK